METVTLDDINGSDLEKGAPPSINKNPFPKGTDFLFYYKLFRAAPFINFGGCGLSLQIAENATGYA